MSDLKGYPSNDDDDNASSHSVKATTKFLASTGFKDDRLMQWPACFCDMNLIENFWAIIKRKVYANLRQFSSKDDLLKAIQDAAASVEPSASGVRSGHASHALHDQIFWDCMTNFCAMRYRFFNLMRNGTGLG